MARDQESWATQGLNLQRTIELVVRIIGDTSVGSVLFVVFCAYGIGLADVWGVHSFMSSGYP